MRWATTRAIAMALLCLCGVTLGDDELAERSRMVSLEFLIAEVETDKSFALGRSEVVANPAELLARLEREDRLLAVTRMHLTTLERYEVRMQLSESLPIEAGRTPAGAAVRGERFSPKAAKASYPVREFGTTVTATPWVEKDGSVRIQFTAERSSLVPAMAESAGAEEDVLPRTVNLSSKGLFRVPLGKSVLLLGSQTTGRENRGELLVLVSAQVFGGHQRAAIMAGADGALMRVFRLRHLSAAAAAESVGQLWSEEGVRTTVDTRSNSLIVRGPPKALDAVESLLRTLDVEKID
jgi:type II secretory pathway component GspD/PulD (secretin)